MKCRQQGCTRTAEIYNLGSDRWECELHHRPISTREASRQTRIQIRDKRAATQRQELDSRLAQALKELGEIEWE
jgi:hypothetical protein